MKTTHEHQWYWFKVTGCECCSVCGVVRRRDDKNKPCKGPWKLREPEATR